jgi:hypothetical protein
VCTRRISRPVAIGRDYADVPPTRGTFKGTTSSTLAASVEDERERQMQQQQQQ